MNQKPNDLAVLVLSCDKYSDLWNPFFVQFKKYFPTQDFPVYFGSNAKKCTEPGVIPLLTGDDPDWSTSLKRILAQIKEPKLFVILEDLLLAEPIHQESFEAALTYLREKDALHIKYWAIPMQIQPGENPRIGEYPKGAPFRATVCGFWDRKYLSELLIEGENPWNFEILGSYRTSYSPGFYALTSPLAAYWNTIEKGCWIPQSVAAAQAAGVQLELDRRPMLKGQNQILSRLKMLYFDWMLHVPWHWRVALMNKLRRALISY